MRRCIPVLALLLACQAGAPAGTGCTRAADCAAPLVCRFERCRAECAENRDCPAGSRCLAGASGAGACSLPVDDVCDAGGTRCAVGLVCVEGACVTACAGPSDCPADGECVGAPGEIGFCRSVLRSDAGALDAGGSSDGMVPRDALLADAPSPTCTTGACGTGVDVCVGSSHACAIRASDHHVLCWGGNSSGQIGDGATGTTATSHPNGTSPHEVLDVSGAPLVAEQLACMGVATCARLPDGGVACWGNDQMGQCGPPIVPVVARARRIAGLPASDAVDHISAGDVSVCAHLASGDVWCWGSIPAPGSAPALSADRHGLSVVFGGAHECAIHGDGTLWCAGSNGWGEIGTGAAIGSTSDVPIEVPLGGTVRSVAPGSDFTCAVVDDRVSCWGHGTDGGLGRGTLPASTCECDATPMPVTSAPGFDRVWAGSAATLVCAQRPSGVVACWGGLNGLCWPSGSTCDVPSVASPLTSARRVSIASTFLCAVLEDGTVACGGQNGSCQLGACSPSRGELDAVCLAPGCPGL